MSSTSQTWEVVGPFGKDSLSGTVIRLDSIADVVVFIREIVVQSESLEIASESGTTSLSSAIRLFMHLNRNSERVGAITLAALYDSEAKCWSGKTHCDDNREAQQKRASGYIEDSDSPVVISTWMRPYVDPGYWVDGRYTILWKILRPLEDIARAIEAGESPVDPRWIPDLLAALALGIKRAEATDQSFAMVGVRQKNPLEAGDAETVLALADDDASVAAKRSDLRELGYVVIEANLKTGGA